MTMTKVPWPTQKKETFSGITVPKEVLSNDLSNCSFEKCTIPEINGRTLTDVSFRKCNFTRSKLTGVKLQGDVTFYECDMSEVIMYDCAGVWSLYIKDSLLRGASIHMSDLRLRIEDCDLTEAALTCSRLDIVANRCKFDKIRFNLSDLSGTFTECTLPFAAAEPLYLPRICSAKQIRCTGGGTFTYGGDGDPVFSPQKDGA